VLILSFPICWNYPVIDERHPWSVNGALITH
jgi:hypothetical protein